MLAAQRNTGPEQACIELTGVTPSWRIRARRLPMFWKSGVNFGEAAMRGHFVAARLMLVSAMLLSGPVRQTPHAQANQPVYPAYDGYLKNPDGSYTLAFAYFSHNADVVTVPSGPANGFSPDP